ncbi:type III pantothenate kinase [Virgibacillus halophilus]|uniref:type III pantothenate kinase n=1 Tax=Tigheibacillus halophilus TaxID=361280 RepID=UPI00363A98C5
MIFVIDVGNTNTVLGVFQDSVLIQEWRIKTDRHKTEDEYAMLIKSLFTDKELTFHDMDGIIISSVVPPIMFALEKMCKDYFYIEPLIVGAGTIQNQLKMRYPNPSEIGADRIVNAIGAIEEYGSPLIIIDFGTATTYCYINDKQEYHGGVIAPGINISMDALYRNTAKLPKIELEAPPRVIGNNTIEAMQSGIFNGSVAQVDGIVNRMQSEMATDAKVIATGGLAPLVSAASETIDVVDTFLTLKGLYLIYQNKMSQQ